MDDLRPEVRFSPDRRITALAGIGALVAAGAAAITDDVPGRLLALVAAVVLAAYATSDLVFAPRLVASPDGIVVHSPLVRCRLTWTEIEDVRADTRYRFGLRSTALEIDAGETLAVLSGRALGTDPAEAARLIRAFRPPS